MPLFPAYADSTGEDADLMDHEACQEKWTKEGEGEGEGDEVEERLLASDEEYPARPAAPPSPPSPPADFYVDRKFDPGNLRVSTLYYPGRPQYDVRRPRHDGVARSRTRRYFACPAAPPDCVAELSDRTRAYRRLLQDEPHDQRLWLRFIDFQESCAGGEAALQAAEEARAALPASRRVRAALFRCRAVLPPHERVAALERELSAPPAPHLLPELWLRRLHEDQALPALRGTLIRALAATRSYPDAYPHLLYAYGGYLRAAGLWEQVCLLLELALAMNFPPGAFPPPRDPAAEAEAERRLREREDAVTRAGLPAHTAWVRVERARAAAHWHAPARADPLDPQRTPPAADLADLLLPAAPAALPLLLLAALRLAKVPLLPRADYLLEAAEPTGAEAGDPHEAATAELLAALARAARRLPPAHPARAAPAPPLLRALLDPPHCLAPGAFRAWLAALWDAACEWTGGEWRQAFLCWRLRWLHALVLALDPQEPASEAEARRLVKEARASLKRWAGSSPLPFAHFARIERASSRLTGAGAGTGAGAAALHAVRAALRGGAASPALRLYVARVAHEELGGAPGTWATVCAALGEPLPDALDRAPPARLLHAALQRCEQGAAAAARDAAGSEPLSVAAAMLPDASEWAAARVRLAPAARRNQLLEELLHAPPQEGALARFYEQSACALSVAAASEHGAAATARALAPLYPHNALLALGAAAGGAALAAGAPRAHAQALARALPALGAAARAGWAAGGARAAAAACARAGRAGAGGALLAAARLQAAAHVSAGAARAAALGALAGWPLHKWAAARAAWWSARDAAGAADVLLDRQLRLHALLEEVRALQGDRRDPQ